MDFEITDKNCSEQFGSVKSSNIYKIRFINKQQEVTGTLSVFLNLVWPKG